MTQVEGTVPEREKEIAVEQPDDERFKAYMSRMKEIRISALKVFEEAGRKTGK